MFRLAVLSSAVAALLAGSAHAQSSTTLEREWELILTGAGSNDQDFDSGGFNAAAQVGYYFTPQMQVSLRQSLGYSDFGSSTWTGATRLGFDYHFHYEDDQRLIPFVGATVGYLYGDDTGETFAAGPEAGVKYYVNDTTFLFGSVAYDIFFDESGDFDSSFDDGQFVYGLGIGFRW